jgi:hypothetical protein
VPSVVGAGRSEVAAHRVTAHDLSATVFRWLLKTKLGQLDNRRQPRDRLSTQTTPVTAETANWARNRPSTDTRVSEADADAPSAHAEWDSLDTNTTRPTVSRGRCGHRATAGTEAADGAGLNVY